MTPQKFKEARVYLGLSQVQLAKVWGISGPNGGRTVGRWERGEVPINPIAAYCIAMMVERGSGLAEK